MSEVKKLYRNEENKVFGGIIGGLGEYFEIDAVLLRLFALFFILATGFFPGILAYLVALLIVPKKPSILQNQGKA